MTLVFIDPMPARQEWVEDLESEIGSRLPGSFRDLLLSVSNGGWVEPVLYRLADDAIGVVAVLGTNRHDHFSIDVRSSQYGHDRLPDGLLPVIDAEGGNLVCLSLREADFGTVWYWDHELEHTDRAASLVAPDLAEFIAGLRPIPEPMPLQVLDVWVDPLLLAEIEADDQAT